MKKKIWLFVMLGCCTFILPVWATADIIVDTGEPVFLYSGVSVDEQQWIAAQINIVAPYTLTDIEAFMWSASDLSKEWVQLAIYRDAGGFVDTSNRLFSQEFSTYSATNYADWYGLTGLNWGLDNPGLYWIAFEVIQNSGYHGALVLSAPGSVILTSGRSDGSGGAFYQTNLEIRNIGLRVEGDLTPIPAPATVLLFGTGLVCLAGCQKKKKT